MIHYYIHYGSPNGGHLYHMKRYHYQHHFVHHDLGKLTNGIRQVMPLTLWSLFNNNKKNAKIMVKVFLGCARLSELTLSFHNKVYECNL